MLWNVSCIVRYVRASRPYFFPSFGVRASTTTTPLLRAEGRFLSPGVALSALIRDCVLFLAGNPSLDERVASFLRRRMCACRATHARSLWNVLSHLKTIIYVYFGTGNVLPSRFRYVELLPPSLSSSLHIPLFLRLGILVPSLLFTYSRVEAARSFSRRIVGDSTTVLVWFG